MQNKTRTRTKFRSGGDGDGGEKQKQKLKLKYSLPTGLNQPRYRSRQGAEEEENIPYTERRSPAVVQLAAVVRESVRRDRRR
jgi:hypothetical protein